MTGRAAGRCAGAGMPESMSPQPGRGFGGGRGRGGGGHGWRNRYCANGLPGRARFGGPGGSAESPSLQQERGCLEDRATALQEQLDVIRRRLNELTHTPSTE
jgi:hypothetical protein